MTLVIILALMFSAYTIFAYRYARYSPWNATWQGITLFAQKITMAALVGFFLLDKLVVIPGRDAVLLVLLTLLMVEAWATLIGLLWVQRTRELVTEKQGTGYVPPEEIQTGEIDLKEKLDD